MDRKLISYYTLGNLVEIDTKDHNLKDMTILFLDAMNDWPTGNYDNIFNFIIDLKEYFGTPLTREKLNQGFNGTNAWNIEAGSSIDRLIEISEKNYNTSDFDKIITLILDYYSDEFAKADFIAELHYLSTEMGGRKSFAKTGYRPQIKFEFSEMQTSGQQTFLEKEIVLPGETVTAKIKILSPEICEGMLTKGIKFDFLEGSQIMGSGVVKAVINDRLERPAGNIA